MLLRVDYYNLVCVNYLCLNYAVLTVILNTCVTATVDTILDQMVQCDRHLDQVYLRQVTCIFRPHRPRAMCIDADYLY